MYFSLLSLFGMVLMGAAWADIGEPPGGSMPLPNTLESKSLGVSGHQLSAAICRECHQAIYQQWQGSMHANSSALQDPIHGAFYQAQVGDPREENVKQEGKYPLCLNCHAPNAARDQKTKLDAMPAYQEGVNCFTCHMAKAYKGVLSTKSNETMKLGIDAYDMSNILQSPSGKVFTQMPIPTPSIESGLAAPTFHPFPMESNTALLRSSELCLACHEQRNNANDVPLCSTGSEFRAAGNFNCQQCHMPVNNGFADHSMAGAHSLAMLERGVILILSAKKDKDGKHISADIELRNMLPHKMPTGAPFRNIYLKVAAYNSKGEQLWQNFQKHPINEDPNAVLMLNLLDNNNKPAMPSEASKLGEDSRLAPREKRQLNYRFAADKVAMVRAELYYERLLPVIKNKFQSIPPHLKEPRLIARAEQRIP